MEQEQSESQPQPKVDFIDELERRLGSTFDSLNADFGKAVQGIRSSVTAYLDATHKRVRALAEQGRLVGKFPTLKGTFEYPLQLENADCYYSNGIKTDRSRAIAQTKLVEESYGLVDKFETIYNPASQTLIEEVGRAGAALGSQTLGSLIEPTVKSIQSLTIKGLLERPKKQQFFVGFSEGCVNLMAAWEMIDWYIQRSCACERGGTHLSAVEQWAANNCLSSEVRALRDQFDSPEALESWWQESKQRIIAHFYGININQVVRGIRTELIYSDIGDVVPIASGVLTVMNRLVKLTVLPERGFEPAIVHEVFPRKSGEPIRPENIGALTHSLKNLLDERPEFRNNSEPTST